MSVRKKLFGAPVKCQIFSQKNVGHAFLRTKKLTKPAEKGFFFRTYWPVPRLVRPRMHQCCAGAVYSGGWVPAVPNGGIKMQPSPSAMGFARRSSGRGGWTERHHARPNEPSLRQRLEERVQQPDTLHSCSPSRKTFALSASVISSALPRQYCLHSARTLPWRAGWRAGGLPHRVINLFKLFVEAGMRGREEKKAF